MPTTPTPFGSDALIRRSPAPVETTVGTEIVLMSLESGQCFGLGETGSDVWRLLAEPMTIAALVRRLHDTYDAPSGEIERDVQELLEKLRTLDLIEITT